MTLQTTSTNPQSYCLLHFIDVIINRPPDFHINGLTFSLTSAQVTAKSLYARSTSRTYWKILIPLSLVHFSGDFYSSFINPLYPVFMDNMGLSLTQVGFLSGISRFLMFIVQPCQAIGPIAIPRAVLF